MEYFAMIILVLIFATAYIRTVDRTNNHNNDNNKK